MRHLAIIVTALLIGCTAEEAASARRGYTNVEKNIATALISDQDEEVLGAQIKAELEKGSEQMPPVKYVKDPVITGYVESIVARIVPLANKDRKANWKVFVIDDPKTVNAFATPGAFIYVFSGLLAAAESEAEIAGVLGHEMGHVVARHSARQMVNAIGLNAIASLVLGNDPNTLAQVAAAVVGNGTMLAHSRADENEADQFAVHYAALAGYDATGIATFFQRLASQQGKTPRILTWLSTHPAPADRVARVNQTIKNMGYQGKGEVGADRLAPIKQRIGAPVNVS